MLRFEVFLSLNSDSTKGGFILIMGDYSLMASCEPEYCNPLMEHLRRISLLLINLILRLSGLKATLCI